MITIFSIHVIFKSSPVINQQQADRRVESAEPISLTATWHSTSARKPPPPCAKSQEEIAETENE
jgi:hypothetical protein